MAHSTDNHLDKMNTGDNFSKIMLLGIVIVSVGAVFYFVDSIPQDPAYHQFADQREFLGVPNFFNVSSNLAFIIIGVYCLLNLVSHTHDTNGLTPKSACYIFFIGLILTGFGSGYYHLSPNNQTLVLDRLPMAVAFMALFSFFLSEHINARVGSRLLWHFLCRPQRMLHRQYRALWLYPVYRHR